MPLFSQQIASHLGPTDLDGYVKRILSERRDDVISELGLTRIEIPFFNVSSELSHLLVLNKLYEARLSITGVVDKHDTSSYYPSTPLQQELKKILKEVNHTAYRHGSKATVRILDLGYTPDGITKLLLSGHENVQGLGIKLHRDVTNTTGKFSPQSHAQLTAYDGDVRSIEAVQRTIECGAVPYTASQGSHAQGFDIVLANAVLLLEAHEPCAHFAYAQLLLAIQNTGLGGVLVIALETRPLGYVVEIISILKQSFEAITAVAPSQTIRPIVYIVCRGFGASEGARRMHSSRIREVLRDMEDVASAATSNRHSAVPEMVEAVEKRQRLFVTVEDILKPIWKEQHRYVHRRLLGELSKDFIYSRSSGVDPKI
ncbi:hypothetical protein FOMPIDRAFT_1054493 [Fomitopsis schrenkii]|uniref:Ribosomal RNA methyltransferase FtsJ domain-containing protein n=1 Tax=Fomitopsis schrenkii TaxID=2126942 RepID=S8F8P8_FOMSC|nr:hypothetical protein FOMPIDRAFT_1054493 [Fomitopsis schrenkii]